MRTLEKWQKKKKEDVWTVSEGGGRRECHQVGTWNWLKKTELKPSTEALIFAADEQGLRTNYVKFHVDKRVRSPLC